MSKTGLFAFPSHFLSIFHPCYCLHLLPFKYLLYDCSKVKVKVKVWTLAIVPLTWVRLVTSSVLQSRKWQLIGISQWCRSALCGHPLPALTDNWTHGAVSRHTIAPISHTRPSPRSRSCYSFPVPLRVGGWVGLSTQLLATCSRLLAVDRVWIEPATAWLRVRYSTNCTIAPILKSTFQFQICGFKVLTHDRHYVSLDITFDKLFLQFQW